MAQPPARDFDPFDDDDLPIDDEAIDCLAGIQVDSFTASPSSVGPFGEGATLRWDVTVPTGCRLAILLNGRLVARSGTQQVQPAVTTRYTLSNRIRGATSALGSVTVRVDTSGCISGVVPENLIRSEIRRAADALDEAEDRFSQRSDPRVEVDSDGIHVSLRFKVAIDNFADPNVDVDFTVGLRVRNGAVDPFYRRFAVDVDWPWWVTVVTAGASKIVEEFIDEEVEEELKPRILTAVREQINDVVDRLPGDLRLHTLRLAENEIRVTACPDPEGGDTPFLVLPTAEPMGDDVAG